MSTEYKVAKRLFEMTQSYLPWRSRTKLCAWESLPDEAKKTWFGKARELIGIVEESCPFSLKFKEGQ